MKIVPTIRALCFALAGLLVLLLFLYAIVSGTCGDGGGGRDACVHAVRMSWLVLGLPALLIGLVGARLVGWEERQEWEETHSNP